MPGCCSPFENAANQQFNQKKVAQELVRYRSKGTGATTRLLVEGIVQSGALNGTVLDVGSGIGGLAFTLLERGATSAVAVDASASYVAAARDEARRRGRADAVRFLHADFVEAADQIAPASIVTLDRVVCCYPSYEELLNAAIDRTERCLALSYPRDVWYVRLGTMLENGQRWLARNSFRTFVHPAARMEETIGRAGFTLAARRETWMWTADVYIQGRVGLGEMGMGTGARLADEDVRAIEAIHEHWMADELAGNATAVLSLCAEDVVWMPPGARPLRGRQTILNWLSGRPVQIHDLRLTNLEIAGDGRVAWKTCEFVTTYQLNGAHPTVDQGSHLWVLHKDDDGVWRVVVATWTLR